MTDHLIDTDLSDYIREIQIKEGRVAPDVITGPIRIAGPAGNPTQPRDGGCLSPDNSWCEGPFSSEPETICADCIDRRRSAHHQGWIIMSLELRDLEFLRWGWQHVLDDGRCGSVIYVFKYDEDKIMATTNLGRGVGELIETLNKVVR